MRRGFRALFLNTGGYRRRRLHDAARLLPVIGSFLVLLPVLWAPAATEARDTAPDGVYLFVVWAGLILAAAAMSARLASDAAAAPGTGPGVAPGAPAADAPAADGPGAGGGPAEG